MKLDWKNDADYEYTRDLTDLGWVWEFIRRSPAYRSAYNVARSAVDNKYGGVWDAQERILYPERYVGESEKSWMLRVDAEGIVPSHEYPSVIAAKAWSLADLYDPTLVYDPAVIVFKTKPCFPAFYGSFPDPKDNTTSSFELFKIMQLRKKNPILNDLRPYDEIFFPSGVEIDRNIVLVAFDARKSTKKQNKIVSKFLAAYAKMLTISGTTHHRDNWPRYLRTLDASDSGEHLTRAEMIGLIETKNYAADDDNEIAKFYDHTLKQAIAVRDRGYKFLLADISS